MKAFLSHASVDKDRVRRMKRDLESHGVECWLDEDEIPFGGEITDYIEKGLSGTDVLLLFLSEKSVKSNWVKQEWQSQLFKQIKKNKIMVIPVLLEKCEIPELLGGRKYADFSDVASYESNLSLLLRQLNREREGVVRKKHEKIVIDSVFRLTKEILDELESESMSFPSTRKILIVKSLTAIQRTGKKVRLSRISPKLKARSVYDHILSVSHVADRLVPQMQHKLESHEMAELARLIAFHELNEVILGDIPTYTELTKERRVSSKIFAENRLRTVPPEIREKIAHDLIWLFLSEKQRLSMEEVSRALGSKNSEVARLFNCFDKLDPIVAVWRYLHVYRGQLGVDAEKFLTAMKDFFENPDVRSFMKSAKVDPKLLELVTFLQTRGNAVAYYRDPEFIDRSQSQLSFSALSVRDAIEGIDLLDLHH